MVSVSPVLTQAEVETEQIIALDQPEFFPIVVARVRFAQGSAATYTRFRLSPAERRLIAEGGDILLSQPHIGALMPIGIQIALPDAYPVAE